MKTLLWLPLAASLAAGGTLAQAAPTGHLGYLRDTTAFVSDARSGRETPLPRGQRVAILRVSPQGDVLYFVARPGQKPKPDYEPSLSDGMLAKAPYKTARQLPGLSGMFVYSAEWNRQGNTIYFTGKGISGAYTPAARRLQRLKTVPAGISRDGQVTVFTDETSIRVKDAAGKERVIFSIKKPQPLFTAISRAKNPKGLADLKGGISADLWKGANNWQFTSLALAPDGKRLYFACNAGTGMGAAGNATWALFACDLATGSISVLSKTGTFFSRSPDVMTVSPDGKRLLMQTSAHSSAIDNACSVFVVDLLTQNSRELLLKHAPKNTDTNLAGGAVWSPDSKYVAFSALYYSTAEITKRLDASPNSDVDFDSKAWRLFIADAATGQVARVIPGATAPSWGR